MNEKDFFLFGVLPSKYSGSVAWPQFGLGFAFVRAEEGSEEESARASF